MLQTKGSNPKIWGKIFTLRSNLYAVLCERAIFKDIGKCFFTMFIGKYKYCKKINIYRIYMIIINLLKKNTCKLVFFCFLF